MESSHAVALAVGLVLGAVLAAAVVVGVAGFDSVGGDLDDGEAELADFEATEPYCGDRSRQSGSSLTTPRVGPGETLVVNSTIPLAGPESGVDGRVRSWGPERFELEVSREPGDVAGDCEYEARFFATVSFPLDDWTLLVTYDGVLVSGHWREGNGGGSFSKTHPEPAPVDEENATAS